MTSQPYTDTHQTYADNGWESVLPLPTGKKANPPTGYTGYQANIPSTPDRYAWAENPNNQNLCLRLPDHIVGIDVDAYDGRPGEATISDLGEECGPLPPTWKSSSRGDTVSGIYLYTIPTGTRLITALSGIELIQSHHRYVVCQPSIHPEGRTYEWVDETTGEVGGIPPINEIPPLPEPWLHRLQEGATTPTSKDKQADVGDILLALPKGEACGHINASVGKILTEGSRHDKYNEATLAVLGSGRRGCPGAMGALGRLHVMFISEVTTGPGARNKAEAQAEWERNLTGACQIVAQEPQGDTCVALAADDLLGLPTTPTIENPTEGDTDSDTAQHTSWTPVNLQEIVDGNYDPPQPTIWARADGQHLIYAGKINALIGESESGKSWAALDAVRQELAAGNHVIIADMEDSAPGVVARLKALGVTNWPQVTYINPQEKWNTQDRENILKIYDPHHPTLTVVDGVNAAMGLFGLEINSNDDATKFNTQFLRSLTRGDCAVLTVDHVPKHTDNRGKGGIGAQAKRAMLDGAAIRVEASVKPAPGKVGHVKLSIDKDRPGGVRAAAKGDLAGKMTIDSTGTNADFEPVTTITIVTPSNDEVDGLRTELMRKISAQLVEEPGMSGAQIEAAIGSKREYVRSAIKGLIDRGYVAVKQGPRGANQHFNTRAYGMAGEGK